MYFYSLEISVRLWVVSLNLWEFCLIYVIYKVILQTTTTIFDNSYLNKLYNEMGSKYLINIKKLLRKTRLEKSQIIPLWRPWFSVLMISMKDHFNKRYINQDLNYFTKYWKIFRNFDKCNFSMIANISLHYRGLCGHNC